VEVDAWVWGAVLASGFLVGFAKGGFGGAGVLAILLLASVVPARESTGLLLPMLICGDLVAVALYHAHSRLKLLLGLLPAAAPGIVVGWLLMPAVPADLFGKVIGVILLSMMVLVVLQRVRPKLLQIDARQRRIAWPLGGMAGVTTMMANAAGPVTTLYLLACRLPKWEFVGTAAWFYLVVNVVKVPFSYSLGLISPSSLLLNLSAVPLVVAGAFFARWVVGQTNQVVFDWLLIGFSIVGALKLLIF